MFFVRCVSERSLFVGKVLVVMIFILGGGNVRSCRVGSMSGIMVLITPYIHVMHSVPISRTQYDAAMSSSTQLQDEVRCVLARCHVLPRLLPVGQEGQSFRRTRFLKKFCCTSLTTSPTRAPSTTTRTCSLHDASTITTI